MADNKIEIQLSAKGGKGAAKEIATPKQAVDDTREAVEMLREELDKVEGEGPQFDAAMEDMEASLREVEAAAERADRSLDAMSGGATKATGRTGNLGMATLEASRAFEDMQYGIRGVLNNIPGLIAQLGGGAGLAGAVSFAAVAATMLAPKLIEMADASAVLRREFEEDQEAIAAASEEMAGRVRDAMDSAMDVQAGMFSRAADERIDAIDAQGEAYERLITKIRATRRAELELINAQAAADVAEIDAAEARGDITSRDAVRQRADVADRVATEQAAAREAEMQDRIDLLQSELNQARMREAERNRAAGEAGGAAEGATGTQSAVDQQIRQAEDAAAAVEDLQAKLSGLNSTMSQIANRPGGFSPAEEARIKAVAAEIEATKTALDLASAAATNLADSLPDEEARAAIAEETKRREEAAKAAQDAAEAAARETEELAKKLELEKELAAIESVKNAQVEAERQRQREAREEIADRRAGDAERREAQAQVDADASRLADDINTRLEMARAQGGNTELISQLQRMADLLDDGTDEAELEMIQRMMGVIERTAARVAQGQSLVQDIARRVADLEAREASNR